MTLKLDLSPLQERALKSRARAAGQQPEEYLLSLSGIADESVEANPNEATTGTAFDLFKGLTGGFAGGCAHLSENTGAAFAEGLAAKRSAGNL